MNCNRSKTRQLGRATTLVHCFVLPLAPEICKEILITYKQNGEIVLEKRKGDLSFTTEQVDEKTKQICYFRLSQEDTKAFTASKKRTDAASVQMRILTVNGDAIRSDIKQISVEDVLNDEVLT